MNRKSKMKKIISTLTAIMLSMLPFAAIAQTQTQTPVNITAVTNQGSPVQLTSFTSLNNSYTFNIQNTTNAQFCAGTDVCVLPTAQTGANAYTIANTRWGTYKLNNDNPGACAPSITYGGSVYCLLEFHFHGPSEHWVNNSATDLEVHYVFFKQSDASGSRGLCNTDSLVVMGQRIVGSGSSANAAWTATFNAIPAASSNGANSSTLSLNIQTLMGIPAGNINAAPSYRYSGGLTAPISIATLGGTQGNSCVSNSNPNNSYPWWGNPQRQLTQQAYPEIVQWVLFRQPILVSVAQVNQFKTKFPDGNARSVQPNASTTIYLANPN